MKAEASPNIAFIKYWGKRPAPSDLERNIGLNSSLSMTLSKAKSTAMVEILKSGDDEVLINEEFASAADVKKISEHLDRIFHFCEETRRPCRVRSANNFPMAAGLASSASAFAALSLAGVATLLGRSAAEKKLLENPHELSALARRGSGSAARSLQGPFCSWEGPHATRLESDWKLYDTVVVLSAEKKKVSSSEGHKVAETSPHMKARLEKVAERMEKMKEALAAKSIERLGLLLEEEALEMHQIMESSLPPIEYQLPQTRALLEELSKLKLRDFYWTLDAGPNPHFISERPIREDLELLLERLKIKGDIWEDERGYGARLLEHG
jgi:diphosphomevalonate decarboxylase